MNKSVWVVMLASAIVVGCGQGGGGSGPGTGGGPGSQTTGPSLPPPPPPPPGRPICDKPTCSLTVTVTGSPPKAIVDPKELEVARRNGDATMVWELTNADYEFRNDSITFTLKACADEFKDMKAIANGKRYHAINGNVTANTCDYTGQVYKRSDGTAVALDPAIINDGN